MENRSGGIPPQNNGGNANANIITTKKQYADVLPAANVLPSSQQQQQQLKHSAANSTNSTTPMLANNANLHHHRDLSSAPGVGDQPMSLQQQQQNVAAQLPLPKQAATTGTATGCSGTSFTPTSSFCELSPTNGKRMISSEGFSSPEESSNNVLPYNRNSAAAESGDVTRRTVAQPQPRVVAGTSMQEAVIPTNATAYQPINTNHNAVSSAFRASGQLHASSSGSPPGPDKDEDHKDNRNRSDDGKLHIDLSNSDQAPDELTNMVDMYVDSYFQEGGTGNTSSRTVDLVIHRLVNEHDLQIVLSPNNKKLGDKVAITPAILSTKDGWYYGKMVDYLRTCFILAKERRLQKLAERSLLRSQNSSNQVKVISQSPESSPPNKRVPMVTSPQMKGVICEEQIEPYSDPYLTARHQAIVGRQRAIRQASSEQTEKGQCNKQGQGPMAATDDAKNVLPTANGIPTADGSAQEKKKKAAQFVVKTVKRPAEFLTPDRSMIPRRMDNEKTPLIANTKKPRTSPSTFTVTGVNYKRGATFTVTGIAPYARKHLQAFTATKTALEPLQQPIAAMPKKKKRPGKPVAAVENLTYDWSSLNLDGTASWNRLIEQHAIESSGEYKPPLRVSGIDTYQLMQNLKDSLRTVAPPDDSPLHSTLSKMKAPSAKEMASDLANGRRIGLSTTEPPPVPASCPEELAPLFPRVAKLYQEMVAQDCIANSGAESLQQRSYQYMTAAELRAHLLDAEKDCTSLELEEERILKTSKQLGLFNYPTTSCVMQEEINVKTAESENAGYWQEDFSSLLKKQNSASRYLMIHDQY